MSSDLRRELDFLPSPRDLITTQRQTMVCAICAQHRFATQRPVPLSWRLRPAPLFCAGLGREVSQPSHYPRYERVAGSVFFALQMLFVLCEILIIYFLAAVLFLAIYHYERNGRLATLLKCLVLAVGGVAILNKLQPLLGLNWF